MMSKELKPWKWAVREVGGNGMWAGANSEEEANANCQAWRADGFEAEVVALYDGADTMRAAMDELREFRAWRDKAFQAHPNRSYIGRLVNVAAVLTSPTPMRKLWQLEENSGRTLGRRALSDALADSDDRLKTLAIELAALARAL